MKKLLALLLASAMSIAIFAGCGKKEQNPGETNSTGDNSPAVSGEYDLSQVNDRVYILAHSGSAGSTNDFYGETFRDLVKEKSGGKMIIEVYNASQLGSDTSAAADVQAGAIDFQITSPAAIPNVVPECAVFDMPFLFNDVQSARKVLLDEEFFDAISAAFEANGLKLFPLNDQGFRCITTNTEITGIDSFKGMTLRTMNNKHHIAWWSALGVACTPLNTSEIFLALQQGMLSGQENPWSQAYDKGLYDVQKYITNSNHVLYVGCMYMGTATWNALTDVERQIIWDAAAESTPLVQQHTDTFEYEMLDKLCNELNMTFVDFDQIPGLREQLHDMTFQVAYDSISGDIGTELIDQFLTAAGYSDEIPQK